jgi:DNA-3-methyladenine glycosylase II
MSKVIIAHLTTVDPVMGGVIAASGAFAMEVNAEATPFLVLARAIAHQQLNGIAANTILKRFIDSVGTNAAFPTPQQVLDAPEATLRAAGFSFAKIASLRDLAAKTIEGVVPDRETLMALSNEEIIERLTQVRGIGRWTVEMMLMFQLGRPDILPVDDFGVRNGFRLAYGLRKMPHPKALALFGERWSPHRSVAAWYLWRAVELHRAGTLPVPAERAKLPRIVRLRRAVKRLEKKVGAKLKNVKRRLRATSRAASRSPVPKRPTSGRAASTTRVGRSRPAIAPKRVASKPAPRRHRVGPKRLRRSR